MTKTIYRIEGGKCHPKTSKDFSGGPSSWNNRYACRRDFHLIGYSDQGSPIVVWQDKKYPKRINLTSVDPFISNTKVIEVG